MFLIIKRNLEAQGDDKNVFGSLLLSTSRSYGN